MSVEWDKVLDRLLDPQFITVATASLLALLGGGITVVKFLAQFRQTHNLLNTKFDDATEEIKQLRASIRPAMMQVEKNEVRTEKRDAQSPDPPV